MSALDALGDALANADVAAIADSEVVLGACVGAFRSDAADALASGVPLTPGAIAAMTSAVSRCRRLGMSLTLLTGTAPAPVDAPQAYTPVGRPLMPSDGASILTARG